MTLSLLDFILIIILVCFGAGGFAVGLIRSLGTLIGTVLGAVVAANYYEKLSSWAGLPFGANPNLVKIIAFLIIFVVVSRLVGFVFFLINKFFTVLSIIPFLKTINRLGGAVLGLLEGGLFLGLLLVFAVKFPFASFLTNAIGGSEVAKFLFDYGKILMPLLPEFFQQAREMIKI